MSNHLRRMESREVCEDESKEVCNPVEREVCETVYNTKCVAVSDVVCKQVQIQHIVNVALAVTGGLQTSSNPTYCHCCYCCQRCRWPSAPWRIGEFVKMCPGLGDNDEDHEMRVIMVIYLWKCLQGSYKVGAFGYWWQIHGCSAKFDISDLSQSLKYTHIADYCTIFN